MPGYSERELIYATILSMCSLHPTLRLLESEPGRGPNPPHQPVALVQLHNFILQFFRVVWSEVELTDVVAPTLLRIVVSQLGLHCVGAQQGKSHKGAGQPSGHNIISQLQAEVVPSRGRKNKENVR